MPAKRRQRELRIGVAEAVKLLRERRGLSARALSLRAGLSPSYVSKIEAGEIEPSFRAFCQMALRLQMSSAEILFLVFQEGREKE